MRSLIAFEFIIACLGGDLTLWEIPSRTASEGRANQPRWKKSQTRHSSARNSFSLSGAFVRFYAKWIGSNFPLFISIRCGVGGAAWLMWAHGFREAVVVPCDKEDESNKLKCSWCLRGNPTEAAHSSFGRKQRQNIGKDRHRQFAAEKCDDQVFSPPAGREQWKTLLFT